MLSDDVNRTIQEIVETRGFAFENHTVITDDGFILEMHRVKLYDDSGITKPVVFM